MESRIPPSHGHNYNEDPHNVGLHSVIEGEEDEHHDEKKSVLKKVKAKAKKIKETLKIHGHGHDHEHNDDHTEEEDEDEEMIEDPEIHGAPIYESAAMRSAVPVQPRGNLERPTAMEEDRYDSKIVDPPGKPVGQVREQNTGQPRRNLGMPTAVVEAHVPEEKPASYSPATYGTKVTDTIGNLGQVREENMGKPRINIGRGTGLEEDPDAPKDGSHKIQAKTTVPTGEGAEETGITPILESFSKMSVYDQAEPKSKSEQETGSHDQFSPDPPSSTKTTTIPQSYDPSKPQDLPRDTLTGKPSESEQGSYKEKIISATYVIADKAVSAKDAVASKLGYGGKEDTASQEMQGQDASKSASPTEYGHKIAATVTEKLAPVYGKVAGAGSSVMSKVPGTGTGNEGGEKGPDKGVSVKEYLAEKFRPSDEDKALSEVISDALHKRKEEEPEKEENTKPMGKVTESEEVARRLGTGEDNSNEGENTGVAAGNVGVGKGVVDRVKGAVGSWFGKGGVSSQGSAGTTYVDDGVQSSAGGESRHRQDAPGEARSEEPRN